VNTKIIRSRVKESPPSKPDLRDQYRKIGIAAVVSAVPYQGARSNPRSPRAPVHASKRQGSKSTKP
jgi:hypothetical protein